MADQAFVNSVADVFIEGHRKNLITNEEERMVVCSSLLGHIIGRSCVTTSISPNVYYANGTQSSIKLSKMPHNFTLNDEMKALLEEASGSVVFGDLLEGLVESGMSGGSETASTVPGQQHLQGIQSLPMTDTIRLALNNLTNEISVISEERWARYCHRLIRFWHQPRTGRINPRIVRTVPYLIFWPEVFHCYMRTKEYGPVEAASKITPKIMEAMAGGGTVALEMIRKEMRFMDAAKMFMNLPQ